MFRNSKGYADPTAGAALSRFTYAERQIVREANTVIDEAIRKEQGNNMRTRRTRWVKAWPKEPAGAAKHPGNGGKSK